MSRGWQQLVCGVLAAAAGIVTLIGGTWLIVDAVSAQQEIARYDAEIETVLEEGDEDAELAPVAHEMFDEHTETTLERDQRVMTLSWVTLAAAIIFTLSGKRLVQLRQGRRPPPPQLVQLRVAALDDAAPARAPATTASDGAAASEPVDVDLAAVDNIVAQHGRDAAAAIPLLHTLQEHYRYLPAAALKRVCELTDITPAQLSGVATFYTHFRRQPRGEHLVSVCHGTACHVAGASRITDELRRQLGIPDHDDTDPRREFTIEQVPCLGCCTLAPVVQIDGTTHGHARADGLPDLIEQCRCGNGDGDDARAVASEPADTPPVGEIRLGMGSCCLANGSGRVHDALQAALVSTGVNVHVKRVGCVGMCHQTPFLEVTAPEGSSALYSRVQPEHARTIVQRHFRPNGVLRRVACVARDSWEELRNDPARRATLERNVELRDPPLEEFLGPQCHIATEHCGHLDPLDLDEYLAHDGFTALERCLCELTAPPHIIAQVEASGLRGRGGAGFPTGRKWRAVREAPGDTKYVICNGDEGDPGAFMDRMLLESYPYRIIEGLAIAAYATGATEGIFYIRNEYPLAVERITEAIARCEQRGLVGDQLLGTDRPLRLRVVQGAGAFVCGEETALIASLSGQRGMPTLRPPYPAQQGLHGCPTLVNNVETYACVPWIIRHGPERFAAIGTATSKGTKVFALTGKIRRGGLIEVPMGVTIRQIVHEIGGGVRAEQTAAGPQPRRFKAVQIGGPSGGCVPERLADTPVDYEALAALGAMMGSGGLVVLDETDCMVDVARYFLTFTQSQSCGKCVPCRIGTRRMLEILERLCAGAGQPEDLQRLEALAHDVEQSSLCGLGKTAPNPVRTTLRYFRAEYEAHLGGHCPAGRCKPLIRYVVTDDCTGCTLCAQQCPAAAIPLTPYERHEIDLDQCTHCDVCRVGCPEGAIRIETPCHA